jgi:seryl-tRNA synthetase
MMDMTFIRENLDLCKVSAVNKNRVVDWDALLAADEKRRMLIGESEKIRAERNKLPKGITEELRAQGKKLKEDLKVVEDELKAVEEVFTPLLLSVPNVPHASVPVGKDEHDNVEVKKVGTPRTFDFPILDHMELAKKHDLLDLERGAKVGGSRAYFLKNDLARLEFSILFYTFTKLIGRGYTPLIAPSLTKEFTFFGVAQLPWGRDEIYHLEKDDLYVSGTAEVPVTAYYSDEILKEEELPKKFVAFSPCFRREAGSYGKDTKGLYRLHQFNKIEQVIINVADEEESLKLHEELLANSEGVLQDLELPYRVLLMCTGDMGEPQVKKYDIETWMPSRNAYGETMSDSYMGDFQARRLKIRYKGTDGTTKFCHTLNNTAIASPRILIPLLENYQNADGTITIPKVLQSYMGKEKIG